MFHRLPVRATFVADTNFVSGTKKKCFWFCPETLCVCNKCFLVCAAQETSWATMCPQQCVLVFQGLYSPANGQTYVLKLVTCKSPWREYEKNTSNVFLVNYFQLLYYFLLLREAMKKCQVIRQKIKQQEKRLPWTWEVWVESHHTGAVGTGITADNVASHALFELQ